MIDAIANKYHYDMMTDDEKTKFLNELITFIIQNKHRIEWVKYSYDHDLIDVNFNIVRYPNNDEGDDGPGNQRLPDLDPVLPIKGAE